MKILAISDCHGELPPWPDVAAELVIFAGDMGRDGHGQTNFYRNEVRAWMEYAPGPVIAIPGNHDEAMMRDRKLFDGMPWTLLIDESLLIEPRDGSDPFWVHGYPWTPAFGNWSFMNHTEEGARKRLDAIPMGTDILISHGPPLGMLDKTFKGEHAGCSLMAERLQEIQPELVICGHIHEGRGEMTIGHTTIMNVSAKTSRSQQGQFTVIDF